MGIVAVSVSQLARFEVIWAILQLKVSNFQVILDILAAETYFIANL